MYSINKPFTVIVRLLAARLFFEQKSQIRLPPRAAYLPRPKRAALPVRTSNAVVSVNGKIGGVQVSCAIGSVGSSAAVEDNIDAVGIEVQAAGTIDAEVGDGSGQDAAVGVSSVDRSRKGVLNVIVVA
jgi:hypothetical protein